MKKIINPITILIAGAITLLIAQPVSAIPVFARLYGTSCATCHEAFPRLNATGEAFRLNGYRFLDDELYIKERPLELGDEAYERLWPDSIWPSDMPGFPPIGVTLTSDLNFDLGGDSDSDINFVFPSGSKILGGGTFGDDMSFFYELGINQGGGDHHGGGSSDGSTSVSLDGWLQFENLTGDDNAMNLRIGTVGMQELGLFTARNHNKMTASSYLYSSWMLPEGDLHEEEEEEGEEHDVHALRSAAQIEDIELTSFTPNNFMLHGQPGLELNGTGPGWRYAFGIINGNGSVDDDNDEKDFYMQLAFKFGGASLDGSIEDDADFTGELSSSNSWIDDSVIISLFGYRGSGLVNASSADGSWEWNNDFWRFGPGIQWRKGNTTLGAGYIFGSDKNPYWPPTNQSVSSESWFIEAQFFAHPWLIPTIRYEGLNVDMPTGIDWLTEDPDQRRLIIGARALIRANIALNVEGIFSSGSGGGDDQIILSLVTAF